MVSSTVILVTGYECDNRGLRRGATCLHLALIPSVSKRAIEGIRGEPIHPPRWSGIPHIDRRISATGRHVGMLHPVIE